MEDRVVYLNGAFVPESEAKVSVLDSGFNAGDGVYDVTRTFDHKPFRLREHTERLFRSLRYTRIDCGMSTEQMAKTTLEVLERNRGLLGANDDCALWQVVSRGVRSAVGNRVRGNPTVVVYSVVVNFPEFASFYVEGAPLVIPSTRRIPPECLESKAKITNKMNHNIASFEAKQVDPRAIPLMTTQDKLGYLLLVKPSVQKLADLRGKTIGISTFGSQLYLTSVTLFRKAGMEPGKDVNLLPAGDNNARIAAMESGKIDAAFVSSPADIFGVKRGYKVLLWSRDHVPLTQNAIVVTDRKLKQSPDQVKRTIKGSIEALKFIRDHQEESVDIAARWLKLDVPTTRAAFENYLPCYSPDGSLSDQAVHDLIQYELDRSTLKKDIPLSQVASRSLLQQAQNELNIR